MNADAGHQPTAREHLRRLNPGEALFRQGDPAAAIFRLESGQIHLLRHTEDGASVLMHVARAGETLAEAALFADAYHCDAIARAPSWVIAIHKRDLLRGCSARPRRGAGTGACDGGTGARPARPAGNPQHTCAYRALSAMRRSGRIRIQDGCQTTASRRSVAISSAV